MHRSTILDNEINYDEVGTPEKLTNGPSCWKSHGTESFRRYIPSYNQTCSSMENPLEKRGFRLGKSTELNRVLTQLPSL